MTAGLFLWRGKVVLSNRRRMVDTQIGTNIRRLREALSMLPRDLARVLGVPEADVLAWESGDARVPAPLFIPCAQALLVPAGSLIAGVSDIEQDPEAGPFDYLIS